MDQLNMGELAKKALEEALRERGHANVLIAGRTGVGKSTLINSIFQGKFATTGQGRPVTQNTREITKQEIPLSIFDTRGLEMADFAATIKALRSFVSERHHDRDQRKHIHVAWVCLAEDLRRVEEAESQLTVMLAEFMPVVGVITKARADQGFRMEVQRLLPAAKNVIRVRAIQEQLDDGYTLPPMGLVELVQLTMEFFSRGAETRLRSGAESRSGSQAATFPPDRRHGSGIGSRNCCQSRPFRRLLPAGARAGRYARRHHDNVWAVAFGRLSEHSGW